MKRIHLRKKGRPKKPAIGDYVLLTRWGDMDIYDPYVWGILTEITERLDRTYYRCGETSQRYFPKCCVITKEEGDEINRKTEEMNPIDNALEEGKL